MISLAIKESHRSTSRRKFGAVIMKGGRILCKAHNSIKTHPTWGGGPLQTLHAEARAISIAVSRGISLKGSTIFVARTGSDSKISKPCKNCRRYLKAHGIRVIVYRNTNGDVIRERNN